MNENAVQTGIADSGQNSDIVENGQNWDHVYPSGQTGAEIFAAGCVMTQISNDPIAGSISGTKYHDIDNDGSITGDAGSAGWTIRLYEVDTPWSLYAEVVTDGDGEYEFTDVPEGSYKVCEVMQNDWTQTFVSNGTTNESPNSAEEGPECRTVNIDDDGETNTVNFGNYYEESIDFCDPTQKPGGKSIAQWHDDNNFDGADCFDYEVVQECGALDVDFTSNATPYNYSFYYALGANTPDIANYEGDGSFPATFNEDQNGGSVEVTYYVVGEEKDYFVGSDVPNIWDGNGVTVTVDTDCAEDQGPDPDGNNRLNVKFEKYHNRNLDKDWDKDTEERLPGFEMRLYKETESGWNLLATTTSSNSRGGFPAQQDAGTYYVCEVKKLGWSQTPASEDVQATNESPNADEEYPLCAAVTYTDEGDRSTVREIGNVHNDLNNQNQFTQSGYKFNNRNGDRSNKLPGNIKEIDPSEERLSGWTMNFYVEGETGWEFIASDVTDENGVYKFPQQTKAGVYHVCEEMQEGWEQVYQDWSGTPYHIVTPNESPNAAIEGPYCSTVTYTDAADRSSKEYFGNRMIDEAPVCEPEQDASADAVTTSDQGLTKAGGAIAAGRSVPESALEADADFFSLGFGGSIVVEFDSFVADVTGDDLAINETTNGNYPREAAEIAVSQDGSTWFTLSEIASNEKNEGGANVTLVDFNETGLSWIKYVQVTDVSDPADFTGSADGFDLNAVVATQTVCDQPADPAPVECHLPYRVDFGDESDEATFTTEAGTGLVIEEVENGYKIGLYDDNRAGVYRMQGTIVFPAGTDTSTFTFTEAGGLDGLEQNHLMYPDEVTFTGNTMTFDLFVNGADDVFTITDDSLVSEANCEAVVPGEEPDPVAEDEFVISGYKYEATSTAATTTLEGWEIELYNGDMEVVATTTTNSEGYYAFVVATGTYSVGEVMQTGWTQSEVRQDGDIVLSEAEMALCSFTLEDEASEIYEGDFRFSAALVENVPEEVSYMCDFYNERDAETGEGDGETGTGGGTLPDNVDEDDGGSSSSGSRSTGTRVRQATPQPLVAGASTSNPSVCPLLTDYMQIGIQNDAWEVTKLQMFLSMVMGYEQPVTGFFGRVTDANVKRFQEQYRDEVLDPWFERGIVPHNRPTGFVYKTTLWKINDIVCPGSVEYPSFEGETLNQNVDVDTTDETY